MVEKGLLYQGLVGSNLSYDPSVSVVSLGKKKIKNDKPLLLQVVLLLL